MIWSAGLPVRSSTVPRSILLGPVPVDDVFGALRARQARGTDSSGVVGKRGVAKARHFGFDADTVQTTAGTVKPRTRQGEPSVACRFRCDAARQTTSTEAFV